MIFKKKRPMKAEEIVLFAMSNTQSKYRWTEEDRTAIAAQARGLSEHLSTDALITALATILTREGRRPECFIPLDPAVCMEMSA